MREQIGESAWVAYRHGTSPEAGQSISRILQSLTAAHTWHYHRMRATTGHVWQGRFKSPVISADAHLLTVMRYVESNPLRAGMVTDLAEYAWSSYLVHGLGGPMERAGGPKSWRSS
jgi:putative transposase